MKTRPFFGGVSLPIVGLGTWQMEHDRRSDAVAALRRGVDLGMTHIDTAEMYGAGKVEKIVAEAIEGRRDEVYLVSKVLPSNASRAGTLKACENSLRRLKVDALDLYLLHWPGSEPLEDTIGAFEQLVEDGKIKAWGVSNFDVDELEAALSIAGPGRMACNQVLYHLEERRIENAVLPWCTEHDVRVVGYSPLGQGVFVDPHTGGGQILAEVGAAHGATPHQVALAFLTRTPNLFTIPKSSNLAHVADNAGAGDLELSAAELARIDEALPAASGGGLPFL